MGIDYVVLARFSLTGIALLLLFLATVTWTRRQDAPGASIFAILVASMAVYVFGYAGEVSQTSLPGAETWLDVEYLAVPWAGGLWVLAACRHGHIKVRAWLLFIVPAITFITHYLNPDHLFYTGPMTLVHRGPFWVMEAQRGPLSMLDNAYLFVSFLAGSWIYVSGYKHASDLFRKQALVLFIASILPFIGYFLYLAGLSPWGLDVTPVTLGISCLLMFYGFFYCGVFNLAPLGRNLIFNSMRDAVLIVDVRERLLDFNPAAAAILPQLTKSALGQAIPKLLAGSSPTLLTALSGRAQTTEFAMSDVEDSLSYELRSWPLFSNPGDRLSGQVGRALILSDVTAQVALREELRRRSETDMLTGIANRRRFHQALELECLRFGRGHAPFSLLMLDLDNFKEINDRYGHPAGDVVLQSVAELLVKTMRKTDLPARYGGEEFSVLLSETKGEGAMVIAERIRAAICEKPIQVADFSIKVSVSVGVATHANNREVNAQILLKKVDLALYQAKAAGRNRVETV